MRMVGAAGVYIWITRVARCDGRMIWCDYMVVLVGGGWIASLVSSVKKLCSW
jgi:hypothetical protein